ncbi:hypothetical protein [Parafrankia sp. FMc2]|uniref:hypothetical protein n=1 Tax=Parafrankia sp. FMc2 TaxID=3233196 RepID=UPI0034D3EBA1
MGYGSFDLDGKPAGYNVAATCEHPHGCTATIDRGLAYACGDMHGADERSCDRYVCTAHLYPAPGGGPYVCAACAGLDENTVTAADEASRERVFALDRLFADLPVQQGRRP